MATERQLLATSDGTEIHLFWQDQEGTSTPSASKWKCANFDVSEWTENEI
jgi:hypothetical protein